MGKNNVQATTEGTEDDAEVRYAQIYKSLVPAEIELTPLYAGTSSTTKKP